MHIEFPPELLFALQQSLQLIFVIVALYLELVLLPFSINEVGVIVFSI